MENFHKYLIQESLLDEDTDQYLIVDSDAEIENPQLRSFMNKKNSSILSQFDLNSQNISRTLFRSQSNIQSGCKCAEMGTLSKVLMGKRQGKQVTESLQEEIAKVQSQCEALESLIQNAVARQADLIVRKNKIGRKINNGNLKSQKKYHMNNRIKVNQPRFSIDEIQLDMDIKKTIKTEKWMNGNKEKKKKRVI